MISRDRKANNIAMTMVPAKGRLGNVMPKAIAITAPKDAPEETPSVEPSANGFFRSPCIAAPAKESAAPTSATHKTRGSRTVSIIVAESSADCSFPKIAL